MLNALKAIFVDPWFDVEWFDQSGLHLVARRPLLMAINVAIRYNGVVKNAFGEVIFDLDPGTVTPEETAAKYRHAIV